MTNNVTYIQQEHIIEQQKAAEEAFLKKFNNGNYTYDNPLVVLNPYLVNPLAAVILFKTQKACAVTITIKGKESIGDIRKTFPKHVEHIIPIVGLYENYNNIVEIELYQGDKSCVCIQTEPLSPELKIVKMMETTHAALKDAFIFLTPALTGITTGIDYLGEIRWICNLNLYCGFERLRNGRICVSSDRIMKYPYYMSGFFEMDLVGKVYREYMIPGAYHHAVEELPDGNFLVLTENLESDTVEDMCVLIDRNTGKILKTFDFKDCLKVGDGPSGSWTKEDWFHNNSLSYDEKTNSISFSGRHMDAIINLDFDTGKLNWIIGDPNGWSEEYQKYFFTPVENPDFGWQYEQHAVKVLEDGSVLCFDNGHWRSKVKDEYRLNKDNYSRGVRYKINTDDMTIDQIWEYGKERGQAFFSRYISNCDYLGEGHYLLHSGGIQLYDGIAAETWVDFSNPKSTVESRTLELVDNEIVMELSVSGNFYRGKKYPIYYDGENLSMEDGKILGNLSVCNQSNRTLDGTIYADLIPEEYKLHIIENRDVILLKGCFDITDQVQFVLTNDTETRIYDVNYLGPLAPFTGKPYLPMSEKNRSIGVNKNGLLGKYDLSVIINDMQYNTEISVVI